MVADRHHFTSGTEKALFLLSRGKCYAPECPRPVLRLDEGRATVLVWIAHICSKKVNGPRHHDPYPLDRRDDFANLLLLCKRHHDLVDDKELVGGRPRGEILYPVEMLREWKQVREGNSAAELRRLDDVTEDKLQEMFTEAIRLTKSEVDATIREIAGRDADLATKLDQLIGETFDRPYIDPDSLEVLEYSARIFAQLPDYAPMLSDSASQLAGMPDYFHILHEAAELLDGLAWKTEALSNAAKAVQQAGIREVANGVDGLRSVVSDLVEAVRHTPALAIAVNELKQATEELRATGVLSEADDEWTPDESHPDVEVRERLWRWFAIGAAVSFGGAIAITIAIAVIVVKVSG